MTRKKIWGILGALAAVGSAMFGSSRAESMHRDPQAGRRGKSKGGGKGVGTIAKTPRFAPPRPGDGENWHRMNRAGWRDTPGHENHARAKRYR